MSEQNTPVVSLDAPELSIAEYRTLREGRELAPKITDETTPAAAEGTQPEATGEVVANTSEEAKQGKKPNGLEFRFSELTSEIKNLKAQLAGKEQPKPAEPQKAQPAISADPEPDASKFTDYTEFQKALVKWEVREARRAEAADVAKSQKQSEAKSKADAWQAKVAATAAELTDFEAIALNPELPVTPVMADAITDSELGTKLLYHLGQNPEEATRISKLSPVAQVRELGKLEAKLAPAAAAAATPQTPKPQVVSKAPAPIRPVGGGSANANPAKAIETMTQSEYRVMRESGKLR